MQAHPDSEAKKLLGAYYTPTALSDVLARFIIRTPVDTVLEPSFGGGAFLRSALEQLKALGASAPEKQIYGCDIDTHAFDHLPNYFNQRMGKDGRRFILRDFLEIENHAFMVNKFDCVLANPPFIGYTKMSVAQRHHSKRILDQFNLNKNRYASLWYYFILNSLLNLKTGGRLAFVLPHAFIDNDYAKSLHTYLANNFKVVVTFSLPNRIFSAQGTKERIAVLVADGWKEATYKTVEKAIHVENFDKLDAYLNILKRKGNIDLRQLRCTVGRVNGALTNSESSLINEVMNSSYSHKLGKYVDIKIGLVTGDVNYFAFNKDKIDQHGLTKQKHFVPLMRSLKENPGLTFSSEDLSKHIDNRKDYYLIKYSDKLLKNDCYHKYLGKYDLSKIDSNKTFRKRDNWCEVDDGNISDLFLSYMSISYPRAVMNEVSARCINNTHRGYFKSKQPIYVKKFICLSLLTSFTRVLAELEAKVYGNKMLKMEPGFYLNLSILIPRNIDIKQTNKCFNEVNHLLRKGESNEASKIASQLVYRECFSTKEALHYERCFEQTRLKLFERRRANS